MVWLQDTSEKSRRAAGWRRLSLSHALELEADRWALWLPIWVGLGISVYFASPAEPALWAAALAAFAAFVAWRLWTSGTLGPLLMAGLAASSFGFGIASLRTHLVMAPALAIPLKGVDIIGSIETVELRPQSGPRLTIAVESFAGWPADQSPKRVRISLMKPADGLRPGQRIGVKADLSPPMRPVVPGGFDFSRAAFFQQIGAIGFTFQSPAILDEAGAPDALRTLHDRISAFRGDIAQRIRAALPGQTGAVASALITGERGPITEATETAFRDSGLAHLLVISGLHMAIVTGAAFLFLRSGLSLVPSIALRLATKKWAAVMAAVLATAYLLISGGAIATVRAYIMVLVMLVAVLLDRPALSLRNVAIAALLILLVRPESLLSAGFQMSFAAVVALVAAYEYFRDRPKPGVRRFDAGRLRRALIWIFGIGLTTVVASAAVAPIAAYHFQRSQQYALLANIIAGPVMNLWVMPLALVSMLLMPFGLEAWPLWLMGLGIDLTQAVAGWIAGLPGAMILVPAMPWTAFVAIVCGGLWLMLWRRRWRLWGLVAIAAGLASAPLRVPADVMVGRDADIVAVRDQSGALATLGTRGRWVVDRWLVHDGDSRKAADVMRAGREACDTDSCSMVTNGFRVALTRHPRAFADDCAVADILIVAFARAPACPTARLVIDERTVQRMGVHHVLFDRQTAGVSTANRWVRERWATVFEGSEATNGVGTDSAATPKPTVPPQPPVAFTVISVDQLRGRRPWVATQVLRDAQWELIRTQRRPSTSAPRDATNAQKTEEEPPGVAESQQLLDVSR